MTKERNHQKAESSIDRLRAMQLADLALDLSAVSGVSPDKALDALRLCLIGPDEPLERSGPQR